MARRSSTAQIDAPEVTEEVAPEVTEEVAPEVAAEADTEATAEVEFDLEPFKAAAQEASTSEADETTGELPKAAIDAVNKVYREINGIKGKNQARAYLDDEMKLAIGAKDITRARAFIDIKDGLSAGSSGGGSTPRQPADPTQAFLQKVVSIRLALTLVEQNVPEGVSPEWTTQADDLAASLGDEVAAYQAYLGDEDADSEAPEVSPVVRQAFKLSTGRGSAGSSRPAGGPRRDVEKHMNQVFADLESGAFLTINEIAKAQSTEYGDDRPSPGAISARLFPKGRDSYKSDTIVATSDEGAARGAVKV